MHIFTLNKHLLKIAARVKGEENPVTDGSDQPSRN